MVLLFSLYSQLLVDKLILKYTLELYIETTVPIYDKHRTSELHYRDIQAIRTMHISTYYNTTIFSKLGIGGDSSCVRTKTIFFYYESGVC